MLPTTLHNFNSDYAKIAKVFIQSAFFAKVFNRCLNAWLSQKPGILLSSVQNLIEHLQLTNNAKETRFYQATLNI
jgi:hypothetical protein